MLYFGGKQKNSLKKIGCRLWFFALMISISFMACFFHPVHAETNYRQSQPVMKKVFKNGLTLIIKQNSGNEVVVVNAFAKMGALYESTSERGISKLMQRVLIKGTTTRNAQDIVYQTESLGASIDSNIENYSSGTVSLKTTLTGFDTGFEIFLDILMHPSFPAKELAKEKTLMVQELKASNDQPAGEAFQNFLKLFYGNLPMGMTPDEIANNVAHMTREEIGNWYRKIYRPGNLVLSIVGNVDPQKIEAILDRTIGTWATGDLPKPAHGDLTVPATVDRQIIRSRNSQAIFLILGYPAPQIGDPDFPVMAVINHIMGSDMGSRLFVELRDKKGLAYNVSTGYEAANYSSYLYTFMATAPANYEAAKAGILKEFAKLTAEPVSLKELEVAKTALKGSYLMEHETNSAQNHFLGSYELMGLGYSFDQDYPGLIDKVIAEDVQRVAAKYFQHYTLSVVSPVEIKE
jgi:predicted Zn-dependent peptidase